MNYDLLIARGFELVPVDGKRPMGVWAMGWPEHHFTADEIESICAGYKEPGVGIKLENLLDFDGDGPDAAAKVESLCLPKSVGWNSTRGLHYLFSLTPEQATWFATSGKIKLGDLELRTGISSQSVLPPSAGRKWLVSLEDCDPVILPDSVFEAIKALAVIKARPEPVFFDPDSADDDRPLSKWDRKVAADWSVFTTAVFDKLAYTHVGPNADGGELYRHPTATQKQSLVFGHDTTPDGIPLVHAFSPNCHGLPARESVTPHRAMAIMLFNEEYPAAIRYIGDGVIDHSCSEFDDLPEIESFPIQEMPVVKEKERQKLTTNHPRLDLTQFSDPLTTYCLALKEKSAADVGAIWFQLNEIFANFLGRNPHFIWSGKKYFINGSLFIIGPTATGKKGLSLSAAKAPFNPMICGEFADDMDFIAYEPLMAGGYQSGQAILTHFSKDKDDIGDKDKRLLMVEQESAALIKMGKVENSILSQVMRTAFDGDKLEYRVSKIKGKESTVAIDNAHVSLIGHITADELLQVLTVGSDKTGELNRIQFVLSLDSKFVSEAKSNFLYENITELQALRTRLLECRRWAAEKRIKFTEPLYECLDNYTEQLEHDLRSGKEKAINARLALYLRKWIARFAVMDMTDVATVAHYDRAMKVVAYLRAANEYVLGEWLDGVDKDLIDKAILTIKESQGGATRASIGKELFGSHWTVDKVEGVLAHARKRLSLSGKIVKEKHDRNKVIYHL